MVRPPPPSYRSLYPGGPPIRGPRRPPPSYRSLFPNRGPRGVAPRPVVGRPVPPAPRIVRPGRPLPAVPRAARGVPVARGAPNPLHPRVRGAPRGGTGGLGRGAALLHAITVAKNLYDDRDVVERTARRVQQGKLPRKDDAMALAMDSLGYGPNERKYMKKHGRPDPMPNSRDVYRFIRNPQRIDNLFGPGRRMGQEQTRGLRRDINRIINNRPLNRHTLNKMRKDVEKQYNKVKRDIERLFGRRRRRRRPPQRRVQVRRGGPPPMRRYGYMKSRMPRDNREFGPVYRPRPVGPVSAAFVPNFYRSNGRYRGYSVGYTGSRLQDFSGRPDPYARRWEIFHQSDYI